ncbi:MAG: 4-phosphopantetheinyl transferase family protein [Alphaproteobacteria bacterium]|nr:MAG: 4-phosphopantetheinyl transferase family protein [Alphaproteobacteria bacterium]
MNLTHEVQISDANDAYTNSRLALKKLLELKGHLVSDLKNDLQLVNFQNLPKFPEYLISISHTKGAGASLLALKKDYLSLGIDIEWSDRHFKPEAQKFLRHIDDSTTENLLELWTMKEAAFKALSPLGFPGTLVLSKIIIQNGEFWTNEKKELRGKVETLKLSSGDRELQIAIARISKSC